MTEYPAPPPSASYPAPPPPSGPPMGYPGGYGFQLPPGVTIAPVGRRIGAFFLMILLYIVTLVIGFIIWGAVLWAKGTSPALRVLNMRCVDANTGQPVGWGKMFVRDFLGGIVQGILSFITYIISFVLFLSGDRHQSIPDKIGGTVVVYDPNKVMG
ncbi:RDD family protein [Jatrophihabitans endophyticus]|uniref:RDD family protein n=1 Tax=Jatrophihabitans endophyticus TaxID=1206085 RepID=UPI0019F4DB17|nr:RDD family protein [Jatrophihabitans endophyticus]MBE7188728.1 RDD family protein [Jatrophihabitans endophyticus]